MQPEMLRAAERLSENVIETLMEQIRTGALAPGDKLPAERNLARMMGVSRPVLREALTYMQRAGIVRTRHGSGTYVQSNFLDRAAPFAGIYPEEEVGAAGSARPEPVSRQAKLRWLFELRFGIESEAAALAAGRANDADLAIIRAAAEKFRRESSRGKLSVAADLQFHMAIVQASGNPYLLEVFMKAKPLLRQSITVSRVRTIADAKRGPVVAAEHATLFQSIASGNATAAGRRMRAHLEAALARLLPQREDEPGRKQPSQRKV